MWDTSKDYRLLVANKSVELFTRALDGKTFKGHWQKRKALDEAEAIQRELQSLLYSYIEPQDLIQSPSLDIIEEKIKQIYDYLGGEGWNHKFRNLATKDEREKLDENIAKVKFFLDTFSGLRKRISLGPINDPVIGIDIFVGEIMSVGKHPKADKLMISNVNLGTQAITVITNDLDIKEGNKVGVSMLPPTAFQGITSEGMFIGAGEGILKDVKGELGKMPQGIPLESLNETRNHVENFIKG